MRHSGPGIPKAQLPSLILMTKMHQVVSPFRDGRLNMSRSLKSRKSRNTRRNVVVALTPSSVGFGPGC